MGLFARILTIMMMMVMREDYRFVLSLKKKDVKWVKVRDRRLAPGAGLL